MNNGRLIACAGATTIALAWVAACGGNQPSSASTDNDAQAGASGSSGSPASSGQGTSSGGQPGGGGGTSGSSGSSGSDGGNGGAPIEGGMGPSDAAASSDSGGAGEGDGGYFVSSCKGNAWPTADPTKPGPFQTMSDKNVGPAAGAIPDPVYGNTQQHFNVYRPMDLSQGGYCHPIILWGNGHTDNPEPNPPDCLASNYCGDYLTILDQLASHGFVVIASLSTIVSEADPTTGLLPQLVGMNWIVQQNDDSTSPYYHYLDTAHIGAAGHSEGAFATSVIGSDPHIFAIATMAGATAMPMLHEPALFLCGGMDTVVPCSDIQQAFDYITTTPVMLEENPQASHGSWIGSITDPYEVAVTAWMRVHLMSDPSLRNMFYGQNCTLCQDTSVMVQRKNMDQ